MEISGRQVIEAPRERVWQALNDPEILRRCVPGCESLEQISEDEYRVAMTATVGPVKSRFKGTLQISDRAPPVSYSIAFNGTGAAGFAKGSARVELSEEGSATCLDYRSEASVGGKLAQFGSRLIEGVAATMSDKFFSAFNAAVAPETAAPPPAPRRFPWLWIVLVGGLVLLLLAYLLGAFD